MTRDDDDPIAAFYDRHPYPPPVTDLNAERAAGLDPDRRRADHHLVWPTIPWCAGERILVAGCGTRQAPRYAARHPHARVIGIDVSAASLDHARALQATERLTNLELIDLPIERVADLGHEFDRVVCTGVLHHLRDPDAGLAALRAVLAPAGALHLMVYAPYGRTGIYMIQEYCRRLRVGTSTAEITELVSVLETLPANHPLTPLLREAPDFWTGDAIADALLNPRDRAYTVPQLLELLAGAGLAFGRWVRQAPYLPQCGLIARTGHGQRLATMPPPDSAAAIELLRGTMLRHNVIAFRDDAPTGLGTMRPDLAARPMTVPIMIPETIILERRLPPGAAAVLINRSHTNPDLALPIRPDEKLLVTAIDGARSIAEITERASIDIRDPSARHHVATLFERLWQHDLIVFDATATANAGTTRDDPSGTEDTR